MQKSKADTGTLFDKQTINKIKTVLIKKGETLSVAESVTSGLLQAAMSSANDAMRFFQGGITAYNLGQKTRLLDINPIHGLECNCVSENVASTMAINICGMFTSDWGIGITGYASPVPESGNTMFCYYAIAYKGKIATHGKITAKDENPFDVQVKYTNHIIRVLQKKLT